jgi:hypothetical protein
MACMQESDHAVHAPVVVPTDPEYAPESVALDGGWIEWGGGDCPVLGSTIVEIQLRNGDGDTDKAVKFDWSVGIPGRRMPCGSDIIKYRLSKP